MRRSRPRLHGRKFSKMSSMTDREKAGLRGPVVVCETEGRSIFPESKATYATRESFHMDGRRREMTRSGDDHWTQRWLYGDGGRPREEIFDGAIAFRRIFIYDLKGRREQVRVHDGDGERLEEFCLFNEDGTRLHTFYPRMKRVDGVMEDSRLHMSVDAVRITTLQDSRGNPLEKVLYNADDRPIQRVLFLYDDTGRLMEEGEAYDDNGIRDDFRNVFRYDAQGRCIEREMHCPFGSERQTTTYNEYGDVSETRRIPLTTDFDLLPQDSWARYFTYEYDDPGNWITCHEELRGLDTGKTTYREEKHRRVDYGKPI